MIANAHCDKQRQLARTGRLAAADEYAGLADAFSRIWQDGAASGESAGAAASRRSIAALYTGLTTESAKSVLDSFLFFMFYEFFRSRSLFRHAASSSSSSRSRHDGKSSSGALAVIADLAIGVAAGACSRAFTTPIANVVTRKQTGAMVEGGEGDAKQLSVREIVNSILKEKGVLGLWSGYSATLVLTLNPGLTFFLQDFLKRSFLSDGELEEDPGPALTFLLAATSKAIASTVTYPFQIAKSRLQAGVPVESENEEESQPEKESRGDLQDGGDTERAVDREIDAKLNATRAVQKFTQQSVFGTIAQIVRTEGVGSLYDGIHGELLKGFFSHGTTMLAKGVIHQWLFKLYLLAAGVLQELKARRQQQQQQLAARQGVSQDIPRALSFKNLEAHNMANESREPKSRPSAPSLVSRLLSPSKKTTTAKKSQSSPSIILNFQDRSHRDFDED